MQTMSSENNRSLLIDNLIIAALWIGSILIVSPPGEFPLNDDWAAAQTVRHLMETGSYAPSGWLAMTLLTNILWGALFCIPAGFSFTALRISTLVISLIGILAVYWIGRDLKLQRPLRIVAALSLGFNPIYYALSNSFMTDVPFTALTTLSALFLLRCLKDDSNVWLGLGIAFAVAATFSRQLGIAIPLAFTAAYIFRFGFSFRSLLRGATPLIICVVLLLVFQHWLYTMGRMPAVYAQQSINLIAVLRRPILLLLREALNSYVSLIYLGLFCVSCLTILIPSIWREHVRRSASIWVAVVIIGGLTWLFSVAAQDPLLPMYGNILNTAGIGPFTLRDTYLLKIGMPQLPHLFWLAITWLGIGAMVLIFAALALFMKQAWRGLRFGKTTFETASSLFLLLGVLAYLFPLFTNEMFDRYLLPALPLFMLCIMNFYTGTEVTMRTRSFQYAGYVVLAATSLFTIGLARDYQTWNHLRWQATNDLMQIHKVSASEIDGGFEFNGWNSYSPDYAIDPNKSWWWVERDTYLISFHSSVLGYNTAKEYTYQHWLPPYTGKIMILQTNDSPKLNWPEQH